MYVINYFLGKNDPRFDFLTPTHKYHSFYKTKLNAQLISMGKVVSSNGCEKDSAMTNEQLEDPKMKTISNNYTNGTRL